MIVSVDGEMVTISRAQAVAVLEACRREIEETEAGPRGARRDDLRAVVAALAAALQLSRRRQDSPGLAANRKGRRAAQLSTL